jgi:hypothetical protein
MAKTPDNLSIEYIRSLFSDHPLATALVDEVASFYRDALTVRRSSATDDLSGYGILVDQEKLEFHGVFFNLNTTTDRVPAAACHELLHLRLRSRGFPLIRSLDLDTVQQAIPADVFGATANTIQNVIDHDIFKDDFVAMGFPIEQFLAKSNDNPDYEIEAKNSRFKATPSQLQFTYWMWWSREYLIQFAGIEQGVKNSESLAEAVEQWGTQVLPGFRQTIILIRQWLKTGRHRQVESYPAALRNLFDIMQIPPISSFYSLKLANSGQITIQLIP